MQCARHPSVETELRCGKCDTPICPRCMLQSPVGARCRDCANLRKPAQYTLDPTLTARAAGAAVGTGIGVGAFWGFLLPSAVAYLGFFSFFLAIGYGWLVAEAMGRAAKRRHGTTMVVLAVISCVLVYVVRNVLVVHHPLIQNDIYGYAFVVIASLVASTYLR